MSAERQLPPLMPCHAMSFAMLMLSMAVHAAADA